MSEMKGYDGAVWDSSFTPKFYGQDDDGNGSAAAWNTFDGVIKVYVNGEWTIFWPPGADGQSGAVILITWSNDSESAVSVTSTATIRVTFNSDGTMDAQKNGGAVVNMTPDVAWLSNSPSGVGADYEISATVSGATPSHNLTNLTGTFSDLNIGRYFEVSDSDPGSSSVDTEITITIRKKSNTSETATATLDLSALYTTE